MNTLLATSSTLFLVALVAGMTQASTITKLRSIDFSPNPQRVAIAVETGVPDPIRVPGIVENKLTCVETQQGQLSCFEVGELVCPDSITVPSTSGPVECDVDCHGQTVPDMDGKCECDIVC